jgi:uncharacterized protein DUF5681
MRTERDKKGEVGFRKPPRSRQFKKGRSGNPKGRPPRASRDADILALLRSALNEEVTVTENGERKKITKAEAMAKQLVNKGAAGDARAIHLLLATLRSIEERLDSAAGEQAEETATQMHMLERLTIEERLELRRLIAKAQGEPLESEVGSEEAVAPSAAEDGKQIVR